MLKVVAFMRQVANGLQMGGTLGRLTYIVVVSMPLLFIVGKEISLLIK